MKINKKVVVILFVALDLISTVLILTVPSRKQQVHLHNGLSKEQMIKIIK